MQRGLGAVILGRTHVAPPAPSVSLSVLSVCCTYHANLGHTAELKKNTENEIPITFSLSNIRCPCIRISLLGNNVLLFAALSGPSLVVAVEPHRDINSARNMGL